ncbi:MAG: glycosyltransferase family 9 protein [Phycisphaerales bacterium]|nr:glycosyltransferase family 9 protein [Phycisphaerales bacterium]
MPIFKAYLKFFFYTTIDTIVKLLYRPNKKNKPQSILLLHFFGLGDYIMMRNYIQEVKTVYPDYNIILVGNATIKDFVAEFDEPLISKYIEVKREFAWKVPCVSFLEGLRYRINTLKEIIKEPYLLVIQPYLSSFFLFDDSIVYCTRANKKIGHQFYCSGMPNNRLFFLTKSYYSTIYTATHTGLLKHGFVAYQEFFSWLLDKPLHTPMQLATPHLKRLAGLPNHYFLFCISAGWVHKKWPFNNFIELGKKLYAIYQTPIVLSGDQQDLTNENQLLINQLDSTIFLNYIGKTSLSEYVSIIKHAQILVCHDSSALHLGVALQKSIFVITIDHLLSIPFAVLYPKTVTTSLYVLSPYYTHPQSVYRCYKDTKKMRSRPYNIPIPPANSMQTITVDKVCTKIHDALS